MSTLTKSDNDNELCNLLFDDDSNIIPVKPQPDFSFQFMENQLNLHTKKVNKVYRVESKEGFGPYTETLWRLINQTPANGRPTPNCDDGFSEAFSEYKQYYGLRSAWFDEFQKACIKENIEIKFGFSSIDQLWTWFHHAEENVILFDIMNFQIKVYEQVEGYDSGTQVIFWNKKD